MTPSKKVCPVEHLAMLESRFRRMLQNPAKILALGSRNQRDDSHRPAWGSVQ